MSKGKAFENFIEKLESFLNSSSNTTVEKNVYLPTKNGILRQIDVLLTHKIDRHNFKTIIECKNWKRRVDIKVIEEFASKIKALNIDKGIIISKSGFTSGLIKEAKAYDNISLYSIDKTTQAIEDILDFNRLGYYRITHTSNEWTVRFLEKLQINQEMKLYTKLKFHEKSTPFDITEIAQDYLTQNQNFLVKKIIDSNKLEDTNIEAEITLDINLTKAAFFEIEKIKTFITGFSCLVKSNVKIFPIEIADLYKYQNLSKKETVAFILKLSLDEETKKLILNNS